MEISKEEQKIISNVEMAVCSYFDVSLNDVVSRNTTNKVSSARNWIYIILHCDYGISIGKLSMEYYRTKRGIKSQISIMRMCLRSIANKEIHEVLLNRIKS